MRYNIPLHVALRDITLHYIRQHKIRLRKHTSHIFTMYIYMYIYIYTINYICACVFFWTPPPKKTQKKTRGGGGQFSQKKLNKKCFVSPAWHHGLPWRSASTTACVKDWLIRPFVDQPLVFLTKHPGFQLLVVDVIGNKTPWKKQNMTNGEKQTMNEDVYISDISYEKPRFVHCLLSFSGEYLQLFWSPHGCDHPGACC